MEPKFGTSGLRGLVTELTPELVADYVRAFASACPLGAGVCVGWDLRPSSPDIAQVAMDTLRDRGVPVLNAGALPTPALALGAMSRDMAAVMITGSHIPADRNGLKFYTPSGEISKIDENRIQAARGQSSSGLTADIRTADFITAYENRYVDAFGPTALNGLRIGVYQHSSVAREIMVRLVQRLGATAVPLGWSDTFIPVDTEAVDPQTRDQLAQWCAQNSLDALISTDGDADRPMVADASGQVVPGDLLGPLTAQSLHADVIVTPVSSNTLVSNMGFSGVIPTRIGSPFVVAAMETAKGKVIGYEANGGLLLGFEAQAPAGTLPPLMTRDCILPIIAPLALATARGLPLAELVASLPQRFTAADRIVGIDSDVARKFLDALSSDAAKRAAFFDCGTSETQIDMTDGLRVHFGEEIIHLRPSGNAPEFRCYTEAASRSRAEALLKVHLDKLAASLTN